GKGKLLVQAFHSDNPTITYAKNYNFQEFFEEEFALGKILSFPPYTQLIKLLYQDEDKKDVEKIVAEKYKELIECCKDDKNIIISQPHVPLVDKVRTKYRKQIIIKNKNTDIPEKLRDFLISQNIKWTIDIDPVTIS
ncbi:MAG: hypothetical protein ABFQ53_02805, partial [Patescibacteria group bacterium]